MRNWDTRVGSRLGETAGSCRLLHDLAVVGLAHSQPLPVRDRLEEALGVDLTRVVVSSLTSPPPPVLPGLERPWAA
jgi:hypothetical protein